MSLKQSQILNREIGLTALVVYYFSTIVGVGIFIVPLFAAKLAGPASMIAWLIALLCAYPFAMIFAHISERYQVSGSIQKFLEDSWGLKFGKSIALFLIISALFGNALLGFSAARYFNELFNIDMNIYALGCLFLLIPLAFNLLKIGLSSKIQTLSLVTLVILIEIIVISAVPHYNADNLIPFTPNGYSSIIPAIIICFYSICGWENVDAMAEEVQNPSKNYRKAAKIAILLISLFYLTIALTVVMVMDYGTISETTTILTAILNITLGVIASKIGGLIAIILLILGANAWVMGTSRIIYALARDNTLPIKLTAVSKNNIPYVAVIAQMIPYLIISSAFILANLTEDTIVEITSLNYLMLYTIIFFSGVKTFTTPKLKLLSFLAMVTTSVLLLMGNYNNIGISIILLLICFLYAHYKYKFKYVM